MYAVEDFIKDFLVADAKVSIVADGTNDMIYQGYAKHLDYPCVRGYTVESLGLRADGWLTIRCKRRKVWYV